MLKLPTTIFLCTLVFFVTFGLTLGLQSVFGLNIAGTLTGPLNLGGNRITNLGPPAAAGDATTRGYEDSRVIGPSAQGLYGTCIAVYESGGHIGTHCNAGAPPAYCVDIGCSACNGCHCPWTNCACPAGYSFVQTGQEGAGTSLYRVFGSCYKN